MKKYLKATEWIKECDITETYMYMEGLCELRDSIPENCQCKYTSTEIADWLIKYEGGISSLYQITQLIQLCYDISYNELNEE